MWYIEANISIFNNNLQNTSKIINMLSCENMVFPYWSYLFAKSSIIMHSNFKGKKENLKY
jgi:hypothetical protein